MSTAISKDVSNAASIATRAIFAGDYAAADEGSYFTSHLAATANTAVAQTTQLLGTTSPTLVIWNGQPAGGYNLYMRYARFRITTAGSGMTSVEHVGVINSDGGAHTTVGTLMATPVNVNGSSGTGSMAKLYAGVNVMAAPAAPSRIVHTGEVDTSIPIVLDSWNLVYGEPASNTNIIGTKTLVKSITVPIAPVIVPPQSFYTLGFWGASWAAAATTYRISVGWIERPTGQ